MALVDAICVVVVMLLVEVETPLAGGNRLLLAIVLALGTSQAPSINSIDRTVANKPMDNLMFIEFLLSVMLPHLRIIDAVFVTVDFKS